MKKKKLTLRKRNKIFIPSGVELNNIAPRGKNFYKHHPSDRNTRKYSSGTNPIIPIVSYTDVLEQKKPDYAR